MYNTGQLLLADSDCRATPHCLTVAQAHQIMRVHAHYSGSVCRQRRAALAHLVEVGHYKLAQRTDGHREHHI